VHSSRLYLDSATCCEHLCCESAAADTGGSRGTVETVGLRVLRTRVVSRLDAVDRRQKCDCTFMELVTARYHISLRAWDWPISQMQGRWYHINVTILWQRLWSSLTSTDGRIKAKIKMWKRHFTGSLLLVWNELDLWTWQLGSRPNICDKNLRFAATFARAHWLLITYKLILL